MVSLIFLTPVFVGLSLAVTPQPSDNGWIAVLSSASGPVLLAIIVLGAINEWWVPGRTHRRIIAEKDELLRLALKGAEMGTKALDTATAIAEISDLIETIRGDSHVKS